MATPEQIKAIAGLYVAYFDRAPDPAGLQFWVDQLDNGRDFSTISQDFADSPEAKEIYPFLETPDVSSLGATTLVTSIFQNLFGREPDVAGLNFWVGVVESGAVAVGDMVEAIMLGAQDTLVNGELILDKTTVENKIDCALEFVTTASNIPGFEFDGDAYSAARGSIEGVDATEESVEAAKFFTTNYFGTAGENSTTVHTLTDPDPILVSPAEADQLVKQTVIYWGYNPHPHDETDGVDNLDGNNPDGNDNNLTNEGPQDGGVPLAALFQYFAGIAGVNITELDTIDTDAGGFPDLAGVTNITLVANGNQVDAANPDAGTSNSNGDNDSSTGGGTLTLHYDDYEADIALGQEYFDLLSSLIFDEEGNSRLFEKEIIAQQPVYVDEDGNVTLVPTGNPIGYIDAVLEGADAVFEAAGPIILTPTANNGSTFELGFTSEADDLIQAGRLELLHGAIIDGGLGYNTLEIDAKGVFAQPAKLDNIQQINIENLPNIYNVATDSGDTDLGENVVYPDLGAGTAYETDSIIDISRAVELQILNVTQGDFENLNPGVDQDPGDLTVTGIRGGAIVEVEGHWDDGADVRLNFAQGSGDGIHVRLINANIESDLEVSHNSPKLTLESTGGGNFIADGDLGGGDSNLRELIITGDAHLFIEGDLDDTFDRETPATIDASANTGGVDLNISDQEQVTFIGSQASDRFAATTADASETAGAADFGTNQSIVVFNAAGDNYYDLTTKELTLTDGGGDITLKADTSGSTVTMGDGDNTIAIDTRELSLTVGDGDNFIDIGQSGQSADNYLNMREFEKNIDITAGDGSNRIEVNTNGTGLSDGVDRDTTVTVTAGDGGNQIKVFGAPIVSISEVADGAGEALRADITITSGSGADEIVAEGATITVKSGGGGDTITLIGTDADFAVDYVDLEGSGGSGSSDFLEQGDVTSKAYFGGALIDVDTGAGSAHVHLGRGDETMRGPLNFIAKDGSVLTGEDITLHVNTYANLVAAEVSGVSRVVLDDDAAVRAASAEANDQYLGDRAQLTITDEQFLAIGADNMDVDGAIFNTHAFVKIVVTESTSLTALGVDDLPRNIDLYLEIQDGVTLTMTAEQLHTRVARDGVTLDQDGNTDLAAGRVVIEGGGGDFDPFNTNDTVSTIINGSVYYGGSLSDDFKIGDAWYNVQVKSILGGVGYNRPADAVVEVSATIDGDLTPEVGALDTWYNNVEIIGNQDITFTGPIELGLLQGENNNLFTIDFSALEGNANGLTLGNFEMVEAVYGNGGIGYDTEVFVEIAANDDDGGSGNVGFDNDNVAEENDDRALISQGVFKYTVTVIDGQVMSELGSTATIRLCDDTEDLETIALRGNWNDTLEILDAAHGLNFELQTGGTLKREGPTHTANVGKIEASFKWDHASTTVDIVRSLEGDTRPIDAAGIVIDNADTIILNSVGPAATVGMIMGNSLNTVDLNAEGDLEVVAKFDVDGDNSVDLIDATDVVGVFTGAVDGNYFPADDMGDMDPTNDVPASGGGDFTFLGGAGGAELTLCDVDDDAAGGVTIDGGTGGVNLTIEGLVDVDQSTLINVGTVTLEDMSTLRISMEDADTIGADNFLIDSGDTAMLHLVGLSDQVFALANYADGITVELVSIAALPEVTLNPLTDLTGVGSLEVPEGTTLNMTALQYAQLTGEGTITGIAADGTPTTNYTVNITDWTQASVDYDEDGNGTVDADEHFDLSGITADNLTITMEEDIELAATDSLGEADVVIGDDMTLTLADVLQADGLMIGGGTNTTLQFTDTTGFLVNIDASGFDIDELRITDLLVSGNNVDYIFEGLSERVTKVIYNGDGDVVGRLQNVVVEEGTTIFGDISFNEYLLDTEVTVINLNLEGGVLLSEDLVLSTVEVNIATNNLIPSYLQELNIISTGTAGNNVNGDTANVIAGDITPAAYGPAVGLGSRDNNLKTVNISAEQDFEVTGKIIFNSHGDDDILGNKPADGITANDDNAATALLNVTGSADVIVGDLDTDDDDVDFLVVNNNGTGDLTVGISSYSTVDAGDVITLNGSATGTDTVVVSGERDFSGDSINADWDVVEFNNNDDGLSGSTPDASNGDVIITVTQQQFIDIGVAGFVADGDGTVQDNDAILNIIAFDGSVPFDATGLDGDITIGTITMAPGVQTLDPTTNLTGVGKIDVPEGGTLNLTAAQYQQLVGNGGSPDLKICAVDGSDANSTIDAGITVNITDLTQADIDGGAFDLSMIEVEGGLVTVDLAASVELSADDVMQDNNGDPVTVIMSDGEDLGIPLFSQADGLLVNGTGTTDVFFRFDDEDGDAVDFSTTLDASGYSVTQLHALNVFLGGRDVEFILDDLDEGVVLVIYNDPEDLGFLNQTNRVVIVEPGVTVPGVGGVALAFNDLDPEDEVVTLTMTLSGGAILDGDIRLDTTTPATGLVASNFQTLTLISTGDGVTENLISGGTNNVIDGDISTVSPGPFLPNNLLNVIINAEQEMEITGTILFNGLTGDDDAASLMVTGTADVTIKALDTTDVDIDSLTISNMGTGTLTITGGSDALELDDTGTLTLEGTGDIVLDTDDGAFNNGIEGDMLTAVDASGLSGNLTAGVLEDVAGDAFTFTAGTGVTTMTVSVAASTLDSTGTLPGDPSDDTAGWTFDYTSAAAGSKLTIEGMAQPVAGSTLNIDMGANGVLCINQDLNLSDLILTLNSAQPIVLADGASLTLTAAQADGLVIVGENGAASTGEVNIVGLGDDPVDLSGISADVAGGVYLVDDDVTLDAATDLGSMTVKLVVNDDSDLNPAGGQTIRLATEAQADGTAIDTILSFVDDGINPVTEVDWTAGNDGSGNVFFNSTNVAWLFNSISGPLDTSNYDDFLGRLWYSNDLLNSVGGAVEDLFNTLPFTIQRVDFNTVTDLDILLASTAVDRFVELTSFTDIDGLVEVDDGPDPEEHIATLTVDFGGEVTAGDFVIGDVVAAPDTDPLTPDFTTLTLNSRLALSDTHFLATEDYVNNNDGTDEAGESVPPTAINSIGDVEVGGTNPLIELMDVVINTFDDQAPGGGNGTVTETNDDAGADFVLGTLIFNSAGDDVDALLTITGENDVTGKAIDVSDADITSVFIDTAGHTGTLVWTGGSPAFIGGDDSGDGNTEELIIDNNNGSPGQVLFGHVFSNLDGILGNDDDYVINTDGTDPYAGIDASTLSLIDTSDHGSVVNLGVVVDIDSEDFRITNDNFGADSGVGGDGVGVGTVTLCLGEGLDADGNLVSPELSATGRWEFDNGTGATGVMNLEMKDVTFNTGGELELDGVTLTITGDIDLTPLDVADISLSNTTIEVAAGATLTLTVEQVDALQTGGINIFGEGEVAVTGESDDSVGTIDTDFGNLNTATVNLSAVTLAAGDTVLEIEANGAEDAAGVDLVVDGDRIAQTIIGSDNNDEVTVTSDASDSDNTTIDVITRLGADSGDIGVPGETPTGNTPTDATPEVQGDVIIDASAGDPTLRIEVDAGFDSILTSGIGGLGNGGVGSPIPPSDVVVVSTGAEFYSGFVSGDWFTTSDSVNDGIAVIEADGSVNEVIDVSAAGGANGWTLIGAADGGGADANTLTGSNQDDTIIDGAASGLNNTGQEDTHTGNDGADTFVFNFATTTPATLTNVENNPALDEEIITAVAGDNSSDESLVINYAIGNTLGSLTVNDINYTNAGFVGDVDFSDPASLAGAIADMMNAITGITAVSDGVDEVLLTGDNGERMNITTLSEGGGAGTSTTGDAGTDTLQDNTVTITGGGSSGELYSLTVELSDGTDIEATFLATGAVSAQDIAEGLRDDFNLASGGVVTASAPGGGLINLQDASADDGGFDVTVLTATTSVGAASVSSLLTGAETNLVDADADVITDFISADGDLISFGLAAGDNSNYDEDAYEDSFVDAQAAADAAFAAPGNEGLIYFLTGTNDVGGTDGGATGLLFLNVDGDNDADAVLSLVGINENNFDEDQII